MKFFDADGNYFLSFRLYVSIFGIGTHHSGVAINSVIYVWQDIEIIQTELIVAVDLKIQIFNKTFDRIFNIVALLSSFISGFPFNNSNAAGFRKYTIF